MKSIMIKILNANSTMEVNNIINDTIKLIENDDTLSVSETLDLITKLRNLRSEISAGTKEDISNEPKKDISAESEISESHIEVEEKELEIKGSQGGHLEDVVETLLKAKERGERLYCDFNGHILHSDTVTWDSAFMAVGGKTYEEYKQGRQRSSDKFNELIRRAKEAKPLYIEKGKALIFPERYDDWEECVEIRINDIYHGLDLEYALKIMEVLEKGVSIEEAKEMFEKQGHTNTSEFIVRDIVFAFSPRGPEFWEASFNGKMTPAFKKMLEEKKKENMRLASKNNYIEENAYVYQLERHL